MWHELAYRTTNYSFEQTRILITCPNRLIKGSYSDCFWKMSYTDLWLHHVSWGHGVSHVFVFYTPASKKLKGGYTGFTLSVCPSGLASCCGFVHTERHPSELGISMRAEGSKNISPWFSRFISDSITLDMLLESDGNFGEVINGTDIHPDSMHLS